MLRRLAAAVLLCAALVSCSQKTTPSAQSSTTPTTTDPAGGPGATSPPDTNFTGSGSGKFCDLVRSYNDQFKKLAASITSSGDLRSALQAINLALTQAAVVAPAEIKSDMTLLSKAYNDEIASLEKVGFDFTKLPPDGQAAFAAPDVQAASTRLGAYSLNVCKAS